MTLTVRHTAPRRALAACALVLGWASLALASDAADSTVAPDFVRPDLAGRPQHLSAYRGKVVLLSFWATWCEPCIADLATFSRWQRQYGKAGLQVIGIAMDDDPAPVRAAVHQYHVAYPVVMGDAELGRLYGGVYGLPLSLLIDRSGRITVRRQGAPDAAQLQEQVRAVLGADPP